MAHACTLLLIILLLLAAPVAASAVSVSLVWDSNNPAPDGYRIFLRSTGQAYDYSKPTWEGSVSQCTIDQLVDGKTYYAVVRAFAGSDESGDSNEVSFTTPAATTTPPANQAPVANAGGDQAVSAGAGVVLNGAASQDPDGSIVAYQWTQTGGQTVALKSGGTAQVSFTAPSVTSSVKLAFQLQVTDNQGSTAVDACQVTVVPVAPLDSDNDGLSDSDEITIYHTDPYNADTDGDGVNDGAEIAAGTDPTVASTQSAASEKVWLEAEDGNVDIPLQIDADAQASEGTYLWAPQGVGSVYAVSSGAGMASYTFTVGSSGIYRVWARILAPTGNDDSFFVSMDGGAFKTWDTEQCTSWDWDLVNSRNGQDPLLFQLAAGAHTLTLMQREDGTKIDRILITNDSQYLPQGQGESQAGSSTGAVAGEIAIEAEIGAITPPMMIQNDTTASSGAYLWVPEGSGNQGTPSSSAGIAEYTFDISASGTYRVWAMVIAPTGDDDSFFVAMDGGAYKIWDTQRSLSWAWDLINSRNENDPLLFQLSAGTHTLTLMQREDGTRIDRIIITSDPQYAPQGQSQSPPATPPATSSGGTGGDVLIEAETAAVTSPMLRGTDSAASSGAYLWVPQNTGNQMTPSAMAGKAEYSFNISASGTYRVWGRVLAPTGDDDSFFVAVDGGAYKIWDTRKSSSWVWDLVNARNEQDPLSFQLSAGAHTLTIMQREDGAKIDKLIITSDINLTPQ